ncbi:phage tail sheath family protein [Pectinatus frisingensis]|uniref:phage tail sheath family protein n=1 Tax=Pectinatus frisingensis TaxID=865 RepID=UPI0018C7C12F|nr:phage tail sheath family protein [Pectinatus frisingensis]
MSYKHGIYGSELATSLVPMTEISAGLPVVFGTAPVHLASSPAAANIPILCYTYSEAVAAFGYSDDWENYTLCEFMKSHFSLFNMCPVVLINVLDPANTAHVTAKTVTLTVSNGTASINDAVILSSLKVQVNQAGQPLTINTDYTAAYDSNNNVVITPLTGGVIASATSIYVSYNKLDASKVMATDIVGGIDTTTGKREGLELVNEIYPRFGLVPGILLAPGWTDKPAVAAVLMAKTENINGCFEAIALLDISTTDCTKYSDVSTWKNTKNYISPYAAACWPKVSLSSVVYHLSTQIAGVLCKTDSNNDDVPYVSPSNQSLQCDSAVDDSGNEIYLDNSQAAYLNSQGIVTALNFIGGWRAWGNRTTAYPSDTDVKDSFIPIRRMFNWVNNELITSFWSKIDNAINKRLINTIVDSANIWLNGLTAKGYILGGKVEFRSDENTTTNLMDGVIYFHVYITPPSPARDIEFVQEYDTDYLANLFDES